ncbi:calmodulin binding protein PICBP-like, partial [Pistacia vera]|uniref:calmodulin binding protein PICBP-like n=1 Tax=Pistacia vera TaxID=55513 RepID=UPI001263CD58
MDSYKVGVETDSQVCADSEMLSISDASSEDENSKSRGKGANDKMKLRSIRLPSLRSCLRPLKSPSLLAAYAPTSQQSTPVVISDASPNYKKPTSCSDAKNGHFQKPSRMLSRRSSFKPVKSLTRVSSTKFRMRKSSGGTDQKKKLNKTRSIKIASFGSSRASVREENAESSFFGDDQNGRNSKIGKPKSDSSTRVFKRTTTLRPQRILTKTVSLKPKRPSKKRSQLSDSSIVRATCSSTLKDSKFSPRIEQQTGGNESGGISAVKVCPYSYCSLHGHRHGNLPPLKRFVSMRRRLLKAQKSMKPDSHPVPKAKHSSNRRKGTKTSQLVSNGVSVQQQAAKDRRENSSVTDEAFRVELKGEGAHFIEDKHIDVSENLTDILFGKTSCLQSRLEQHMTSNSLEDKPSIQAGSLSTFQETNEDEYCNKAIEPVKRIPEASDSKRTEEKIVASDIHRGDNKLIHTLDHRETIDSCLREVKDSIQSDNLSLKLDDIVSTSNEGGPVDAAVNQEVNGETVASLNLEMFKGYSGSKKVVDVSTTTREIDEDFEPDNRFHEGFSQSGDPLPNFTTDGCHKTQIKKQNFTGFWGMIYQHMVSGIATEVETQLPLDGKDKEEQDEEDHTLSHNNDPVSHQSPSGTDQDMEMRDGDAGNQKSELWQSDAIKLVQEAFDKILSEIPDQSSDDQSITSETTSEQDFLERKQVEDGEDNISCSFDGTNESVVQDPEETQLTVVNTEERKAASQPGDKSSQQISKNWSNLKKVIILKRFVKALEKVRNFNPPKPQCLPVEPDSETEKVNLRHQTTEERKVAEEWMLDFALRQVISKLAPAQKRKVALLVQAFETVSPLPETRTHMRSNARASAHATPAQATSEQNNKLLSKAPYAEMSMSFKETPDQVSDCAKQLIPGTCSELKERSLPCGDSNTVMRTLASEAAQANLEEERTIACNPDKMDNNSMFTEYQPDFIDSSPTKLENSTFSDKASSKLDDTMGTSHEELVNGKILTEIYDLQVNELDIKFNNEKLETDKAADEQACPPKSSSPENYAETTAVNSVTTSASFCELLEAPATAGGEEADQKYEVLQESSELEEPESNNTTNISEEAKMEKQKYRRLWYLIYKHMVSSNTEGGTQSLLEDVGNKEQGGEANVLLGTKNADSCDDLSVSNQETIVDNKNRSSRKIELDQIEAIKLIEEAIDEIQLPEIQDDSPDDQSITGNVNPEMEAQKKHGEDGELFILTTNDTAEDTYRESKNRKSDHLKTVDQREPWLNSNNTNAPEEPETIPKLGNKSKPQMQKSWSNLKKLILLQKFIKALEKVRKFNSQEPRYLPLDPASEAEKVHLRHQNTEDRKNAEEWKLDYALQQEVAK